MLYLKSFCFNLFQENTYVLYDDTNTAFIIDPGNSNEYENNQLKQFIEDKNLVVKRFLLTHAHIDHILGARFVTDTYNLLPEVHKADVYFIERMPESAMRFGVNFEQAPLPEKFIEEGDQISLGKYQFDCIYAPGHSPGSICFYNKETRILIGGDVLFNGSIGRSDLPMGDHTTLINSIKTRLFTLPDNVKVYPGHGPATTIAHERNNNPFVR